MMAAPTGVKVAEPANANAATNANAVAAQVTASAGAVVESKVAVGAGAVASNASVGRMPAAKATIMGAGIAPRQAAAEPQGPPAVRAVIDVPVSPVPERPVAAAAAAQQPAPPQAARPAANVHVQPDAMPGHASHYLPGDPMAPPSAAERHAHGQHSQRLHIEHEHGAPAIPKDERIWLYWAVCGVVVLSVLVLAIGLF